MMESIEMRSRANRRKAPSSIQGAACVIEGDQEVRVSLCMLLRTLRVKVLTFSTAEEFLDGLNAGTPAVVVTELALPGMSGFELKEALDEMGIEIPVIGLTGEVSPGDRREAGRLGFLELIEKPFVYWSVVDWVQRTLVPGGDGDLR